MEEELLNEEKLEIENPNEIIEIEENEEIPTTQYDLNDFAEKVEDTSKKKEKKPSKWSKLTKKQRVIIIASIVLVLLIIIVVLLYFFVFKKDDKKPAKKNEPTVIIEKDNYKYEDGKLVFINNAKEEIGEYECTNKNEDLCYVAYYSSEDNFDIAKKVYEDKTEVKNRSDILFENYVFIYDDIKKEKGEVILYNIKENKTEGKYSLVKEVSSDKAIVKKNDKYGLLSFTNNGINEELKLNYEYLGFIENGKYLITSSNRNYKLIDFTGEDVSKSVPGEIKNYDDNNLSVKIGGDYYIYDYQGKRLVDVKYDYIRFVDSYILGIDNKKLYIRDKDGSIMNGEGIRIDSNDYNTKLIFNDDLRQTGKEEAFSAVVNGNTMRLEYDEEYLNVNLNEGNFNKNLSYINYFAGKLYFYSDEAKTKLLGTYQCSYANAVDEETTSLEYCFVAKEKNIFKKDDKDILNGYLPIYNNRYVFISDTKSPNSNDNIILYDLETSKKMATYKEVDSGYHNGDENVTFADTAGTLAITYSIKNSSYGLINIASKSIKTIIPFVDDYGNTNTEVKMLGENLLFKRNDGTYHLYTNKGVEITSKVTTKNEIIEYKDNYLVVKNDKNKYVIYSLDGKIVSDELNYVILDKNFYVGVDKDDYVGVYKYTDPKRINELANETDGKDYKMEVNYEIINNGKTVVLYNTEDNQKNSIEVNIE